jgi:hypothetical protein
LPVLHPALVALGVAALFGCVYFVVTHALGVPEARTTMDGFLSRLRRR